MKKRVLIVAPYFYPEGGGLERYAFDMARELSKKHKVDVLCMTRREESLEEIGGIKVHRLRPSVIVSNTPLSLKFILEAARLIKESDFVIAHTPVPFAADVASILAKFRGIPVRIVYHTVGLQKGVGLLDIIAYVYSAMVERLVLRGAELVAVSRTVWVYLKKRGYNSRISYPKIRLSEYSSKWERGSQGNVILFVSQLGRYHMFKNLTLLLRAFSRISSRYPMWELWIVGDGDMKKEYISLASKLGISQKVRFLGWINDPNELARVYSIAKMLVLPSSFESFGMVVLEAQTFGVPVVVSPHVGSKVFVLEDKTGIILKRLDIKLLEDAIETLISNPKQLRKMATISRRFIQHKIKSFS